MRVFSVALVVWVLGIMPAMSQDVLPDRRLIVSRDVDFYGADLQALFDTTYEACQNLCLNDADCQAFTFNSRSNSCFPKSTVNEEKPYEGALSARVFATTQADQDRATTRASDLSFLSKRDLGNATNTAQKLGVVHAGGKWTPEALIKAARDREALGNMADAAYWMGASAAQTDAADQWVDYARLSLAAAKSTKNTSNKRLYRTRAIPAAVNGYLRAPSTPAQVSALMQLAEAFVVNGRGRDMIPALRLAETLQPRADVTAALDKAIGKYGFRIVEHKVQSDLALPRVCAEFSERLVRTGVDYTPFVKLPDATLVVQNEGNQLCIEGFDHGSRVTVTFRAGLPAASGETMVKDVPLTMYIGDRSPLVRFPGRAYVLPRSADAALPIDTVNVSEVDLTLSRISDRNLLRSLQDNFFGRPLSVYRENQFKTEIAEEVWKGTGEVENTLNIDVTTRLPMGDVIADLPAGVYALSATIPGTDRYDDPGVTQWFVLSDLGITTLSGTDGLHVFVRGLNDATAKTGVEVTLLSKANRVLGTATTDGMGYARFDAGLTRGTQGATPALVTVKDGDDDIAFLSLTDPAFDLSDRGVEGREPAPPIDLFLTTDRGAYRAGEVIYATALTRDAQVRAIDGLPVTAILTRPDGVEYARHLSNGGTAGGHVFTMPLGGTVPRGTWRLAVHSDVDAPPLANQTFLVEDFVPEKIDFDLTLPEGPIRLGSKPDLTINARYLFGAPGGDLPIEGEVRLRARDTLSGQPGYRFGRYDTRPGTRTTSLTGAPRTDAGGLATFPLTLPSIDQTGHPLEVEIVARVSEGSGRPVERRLTREVLPQTPMIGIKPLFDDVVTEGTEAAFDLIALNPDLSPATMPVRWTLNRVQTRYQWYKLYGRWEWEPTTSRRKVASGEAVLGNGVVSVSAPVEWGRYELIVERANGAYVAAAVDFYAGWYAPADTSATPDTLELSLDKPGYRSGETAQLRIVPRQAGTALVQVMSNRLISMQAIDVQEGENLISLPVTDDWGTGVYVTASVLSPMDVANGLNPARALGLSYAAIDPGAKRLNVSIDAPDQTAPRGPLMASVVLDGAPQGETAWVTVAAVDVGILNLTGFDSPDPAGHYFGQRRLGMEIRDVYGRLINGLDGNMGRIRSGGDAAQGMRMESPPPTEELVAYFTGPVQLGADGRANVSFDMPEFNGTVRLMAVAWTPTAVGQAEAEVLVRDPVVVTASLPRFLSPGDSSRIRLDIVHASGPSGRMGLDVTGNGITLNTSSVPSGVTLTDLGKTTLSIPVTASDVGDHKIRVALTTPDGKQLVKTVTLPVRINDPEVSVTRRFSLSPGSTFNFDAEVFDAVHPASAQAMLSAGPLARFDAPALLARLNRYPYGCTEQVTSKAMPLLYFDTVAKAMGLGEAETIQKRVDQAVAKILTRQSSNGAFGLWRADSGDFWLDAYVSDFLSRAKSQGYVVPELAFRNAMDNLRNHINYVPDFEKGGEDIAYALMVLAREGAASMGDLRYYADVKADAFATPLALAQMGAALAMYGDQTRADAMFAKAGARLSASAATEAPVWRADYGTALRDAAGVLSLAVESGSNAIDRETLVGWIGAPGRPLSTQEQSWALLAAHALVKDPSVSGLQVDGSPVDGPFIRMLKGADALRPMQITNTGAQPTDITLTTIGVPNQPEPAGGYGYAIERVYYTLEGQPITDAIKVGDRFVTVITVSPAEKTGARLMVNDPLPAGFEIDNPNLLRAGDVRSIPWLKPNSATHTEFRSDRFLAAIDWRGDKPFQLAYIVRAVSPGTFHHPAASVEDMYRAQYRARTVTGDLVILE